MQEYSKILIHGCHLRFEEYLHEKKMSLNPKTLRETDKRFEEILGGRKVVKNMKYFE